MPRQYWWLTGIDQGQKFLIFGSDVGESDAQQKGLEMLPGINFEIIRLPTRHMATASSMLKGTTLQRTRNLHRATRKLKHKNIGRNRYG